MFSSRLRVRSFPRFSASSLSSEGILPGMGRRPNEKRARSGLPFAGERTFFNVFQTLGTRKTNHPVFTSLFSASPWLRGVMKRKCVSYGFVVH